MKSSNLRSLLFSAGSAVLAGVLFFSVNAAYGEDPAVAPPGNAIHPTFSGLTVSGAIDAQGVINDSTDNTVGFSRDVIVSGKLKAGIIWAHSIEPIVGIFNSEVGTNGENLPVTITDPDGLKVNGDIVVQNDLTVSGGVDFNYFNAYQTVYITPNGTTSPVSYLQSVSCPAGQRMVYCGWERWNRNFLFVQYPGVTMYDSFCVGQFSLGQHNDTTTVKLRALCL